MLATAPWSAHATAARAAPRLTLLHYGTPTDDNDLDDTLREAAIALVGRPAPADGGFHDDNVLAPSFAALAAIPADLRFEALVPARSPLAYADAVAQALAHAVGNLASTGGAGAWQTAGKIAAITRPAPGGGADGVGGNLSSSAVGLGAVGTQQLAALLALLHEAESAQRGAGDIVPSLLAPVLLSSPGAAAGGAGGKRTGAGAASGTGAASGAGAAAASDVTPARALSVATTIGALAAAGAPLADVLARHVALREAAYEAVTAHLAHVRRNLPHAQMAALSAALGL